MNNDLQPTPVQGLRWSGGTDRGTVRLNNEDAFLGLQFDAFEVHHLGKIGEGSTHHMDFAFAVSDGMGGALAGEHASRITVEKITTLLPRTYKQAAAGLDVGFVDVLGELFTQIHESLSFMGRCYAECRGMEATLSLGWFTQSKLYFGHIGDSRVYHLPAGASEIKQLSQDDTHVDWLRRNGKINEREARNHPRRSVLQKALGGTNQFVMPQVGSVIYEPGDIFLLCTDGVVNGLYDVDLVELLRSGGSPDRNFNRAERLVRESVLRDGRDNTTALVIQAF